MRDVTKTYERGALGAAVRAAAPVGPARRLGPIRALDGVDLDVVAGEGLGIIGPNGAGKSTLLGVVAGLVEVDRGTCAVDGRIVPLLDPEATLHPELTGRENLRIGARLLGLGPDGLDPLVPSVLEFAGLGDAVDAPVRQYSTGMRARLGLSLALHLPGDLLLIDEILVSGDEGFRRLALEAVEARRREGNAVLFVSHELELVEQLCDRVVRLEHGRVVDDGPAATVIDRYGGSNWAAGVHDAVASVRVTDLEVRQRHIPVGGTIELEAEVVVDDPAPAARLEVAYRVPPDDREEVMTQASREELSFYLHTVAHPGGFLAEPGRYRVAVSIPRHEFAGGFDLVLAAVDSMDETVLAESWQEVVVGAPRPEGFPGPVLRFDWEIEPLPPERVAADPESAR